jgi:hypothetical protein
LEVGGPLRVDATGQWTRRAIEAVVAMLEAVCTTGRRLAATHHVGVAHYTLRDHACITFRPAKIILEIRLLASREIIE